MLEKEYPQKVIAIYEAVASLMHEGRDMYKLTVSDITTRAGIGKGTAYEYFSSKDEIISKAVCYQVEKIMIYMRVQINACQTLDGQMKQIVQWASAAKTMDVIYLFFKRQVEQSSAEEMQDKVKSMGAVKEEMMLFLADAMLKAAEQEGIIEKTADIVYARTVMASVILIIYEQVMSQQSNGFFKDLTTDQMLQYMRRMIKQSLMDL